MSQIFINIKMIFLKIVYHHVLDYHKAVNMNKFLLHISINRRTSKTVVSKSNKSQKYILYDSI